MQNQDKNRSSTTRGQAFHLVYCLPSICTHWLKFSLLKQVQLSSISKSPSVLYDRHSMRNIEIGNYIVKIKHGIYIWILKQFSSVHYLSFLMKFSDLLILCHGCTAKWLDICFPTMRPRIKSAYGWFVKKSPSWHHLSVEVIPICGTLEFAWKPHHGLIQALRVILGWWYCLSIVVIAQDHRSLWVSVWVYRVQHFDHAR